MTAAEQFNARSGRIEDAIQLQVPDRVPVLANFRYFAAKYAGLTPACAFYDAEGWMAANKKAILDFQPDLYYAPLTDSGKAFEILGMKQVRWPGHGVPVNASHQFVEGEYMKADEYDKFLEDVSGYALTTYLPRLCEALEPLSTLPSFKTLLFGNAGLSELAATLARPEIEKALQNLIRAGHEINHTRAVVHNFNQDMAVLGYPCISGHATSAFDVLSDLHRGMRGSMLDMYYRPDKLLQAIEKLEPITLQRTLDSARLHGSTRIQVPLHRGADGFMSDDQFRELYWPNLKRLLLALIDANLTPCVFFEGGYNSRLKYLRELPPGKILARFDTTDVFAAKDIIGDVVCICGNMPVSILQVGSIDDVKAYAKKLIDIVGRNGGFVMCTRGVLDETKPENVKAWFEFTKEYGVY